MLRTNEFFCFELEMGGRILAWFGIILNGIIAMILTQGFWSLNLIVGQLNRASYGRYSGYSEYSYQSNNDKYLTVIKVTFGFGILLYTGLAIISVLLNIGIKNRNRKLILPSVILSAIQTTILAIVALVMAFKVPDAMIINFINLIFNFYVTVVLFSLYEKIKNDGRIVKNAV